MSSWKLQMMRSKTSLLACNIFTFLLIGEIAWAEGGLIPREPVREGPFQVRSVIDGDSLLLSDGRQVRFLGIDCGEVYDTPDDEWIAGQNEVPFQKYQANAFKAKEKIREFVEGKEIYLARDPNFKSSNYQDHLNREVAYVYSGDVMLNAYLLKEGVCHTPAAMKDIYHSERAAFKKYEKEAKRNKKGLWASGNES